MRPAVSRKATSFSPSNCTRTGGQSGSGISQDKTAGIQYRRMVSPIAVPEPVCVSSSFSATDNISRVSSVQRLISTSLSDQTIVDVDVVRDDVYPNPHACHLLLSLRPA